MIAVFIIAYVLNFQFSFNWDVLIVVDYVDEELNRAVHLSILF